MRFRFMQWLAAFCLACTLLACTDHRLGGVLSPTRLRLKTIQDGITTRTYTYDSQNRLATITNGTPVSVFKYDDVQKTAQVNQYTDASQTTGTAIIFPYSTVGLSSFTTQLYTINNSVLTPTLSDASYGVNTSGQVVSVTQDAAFGASVRVYTYTYVGSNVASRSYTQGRAQAEITSYEYDTNINPFFGSTDPGLSDVQRFSRNNVLKMTTTASGISGTPIVYQYEYNQQGLPTKSGSSQSGSPMLTYSYESY